MRQIKQAPHLHICRVPSTYSKSLSCFSLATHDLQTAMQGSEQRAAAWRGKGNSESLLELLSSFFALYSNAVAVWSDSRSDRYLYNWTSCDLYLPA